MIEPQTTGYLALPTASRGLGVLVLHAWWGLTGFVRQVCDRLAGEGFCALAPDLYHGATAATIDEAKKLRNHMDREAAQAEIGAALDGLLRHPAVQGAHVAVMGFSLGANYALWLADRRPKDVAAVVVFYGTSGIRFRKAQAAFLGHFAEQDPYEPRDSVQQLEDRLRSAGRDVSFHVYPGTGHWFFEQDRPDAYDAGAAGLAWQRTIAFLSATLGEQ